MIKVTGLILCLVLLTSALAASPSCNVSSLSGIASGVLILGVPAATTAQTSFSQSLSGFNLNLNA